METACLRGYYGTRVASSIFIEDMAASCSRIILPHTPTPASALARSQARTHVRVYLQDNLPCSLISGNATTNCLDESTGLLCLQRAQDLDAFKGWALSQWFECTGEPNSLSASANAVYDSIPILQATRWRPEVKGTSLKLPPAFNRLGKLGNTSRLSRDWRQERQPEIGSMWLNYRKLEPLDMSHHLKIEQGCQKRRSEDEGGGKEESDWFPRPHETAK
ncbi:unnamed protein product [Mesocestoides corti]|uniref:Uncharacterized protein n=1 Tax=Mesocestoides corti TaxID=53468 RepID=A0A0R3U8C6_MESCO|nr:unnamed protein product [Mesocestoides corti]